MEKKPSLGRIVLFTGTVLPNARIPPEQMAAIITKVFDQSSVMLFVLDHSRGSHFAKARFSEDLEPFTWHWPEVQK